MFLTSETMWLLPKKYYKRTTNTNDHSHKLNERKIEWAIGYVLISGICLSIGKPKFNVLFTFKEKIDTTSILYSEQFLELIVWRKRQKKLFVKWKQMPIWYHCITLIDCYCFSSIYGFCSFTLFSVSKADLLVRTLQKANYFFSGILQRRLVNSKAEW